MFLFFVLYHLMLSGSYYGGKFSMGFFGGLNFGPGSFLGFDLMPPFDHPCHLKSGVPPPPPPPPPGTQRLFSVELSIT